jgi:hypothetical protein
MKSDHKSSPKNPTYQQVRDIAYEFFQYDKDKLDAWWMTKQDELDNKAPYELVKEGKGRMLIKLLERCAL